MTTEECRLRRAYNMMLLRHCCHLEAQALWLHGDSCWEAHSRTPAGYEWRQHMELRVVVCLDRDITGWMLKYMSLR